jgi:hypothetical protein
MEKVPDFDASDHGRLHTTGLPARLARFRPVVGYVERPMSVGQAYRKGLFLLVANRSHAGILEEALDLRFDPPARVRRHGAKGAPFSITQVDGDEAAGISVH